LLWFELPLLSQPKSRALQLLSDDREQQMSVDNYQTTAAIYARCIPHILKQLRRDIQTFVNFKKYRNVIDICCGTGDQLVLLDGPGMHLCGIDNSVAMLEAARHNCPDPIELHLLDAEQESFAAGSFDCAILSLSLHEKHPTAAQTIYGNSLKLIRQGGSLIIADFCQVPSSLGGSMVGSFLIPIVERIAGRNHYQNYLKWLEQGALEGFLARQQASCEIISRRYQNTVLCCAIEIDAESRLKEKSYALLNQTLESRRPTLPNTR
jgi:demethylmenaquinone methyltransferase/2-methoxy-6-polyprenyl-1,4-benzoquinol methylase